RLSAESGKAGRIVGRAGGRCQLPLAAGAVEAGGMGVIEPLVETAPARPLPDPAGKWRAAVPPPPAPRPAPPHRGGRWPARTAGHNRGGDARGLFRVPRSLVALRPPNEARPRRRGRSAALPERAPRRGAGSPAPPPRGRSAPGRDPTHGGGSRLQAG